MVIHVYVNKEVNYTTILKRICGYPNLQFSNILMTVQKILQV